MGCSSIWRGALHYLIYLFENIGVFESILTYEPSACTIAMTFAKNGGFFMQQTKMTLQELIDTAEARLADLNYSIPYERHPQIG